MQQAAATAQLYDASRLNAEAIQLLDTRLNSMCGNSKTLGITEVVRQLDAMASAAKQYIADVEGAAAATEELHQKIGDGTVSMQDIARATHKTSSAIAVLDSATLNNLNNAIDAAPFPRPPAPQTRLAATPNRPRPRIRRPNRGMVGGNCRITQHGERS